MDFHPPRTIQEEEEEVDKTQEAARSFSWSVGYEFYLAELCFSESSGLASPSYLCSPDQAAAALQASERFISKQASNKQKMVYIMDEMASSSSSSSAAGVSSVPGSAGAGIRF